MVGDTTSKIGAAMKEALELENWMVSNSCITISGVCVLALSNAGRKDRDDTIVDLKTRKAMILTISQEGDLIHDKTVSPITDEEIMQEEILINFAGEEVII